MNRRIIQTVGAAAAGLAAAAFLPMATAFADTTDGDAAASVVAAAPAPSAAPTAPEATPAKANDVAGLHHKVCVPQAAGLNWVGALRCVLVP